jgi:beta-lactam-binding protein with PASTA domain
MRRFRRGRHALALGGLAGVLLILGIVLAVVVLGGGDASPEMAREAVTVPAVVGLRMPAAKVELARSGLATAVELRRSRKPVGRVLGQRPRAGSRIEPGRAILLIVSRGRAAGSSSPVVAPTTSTATEPTETQPARTAPLETEPVDTVRIGPEPPLGQVPGVLQIGFVDSASAVEERGFVADTYPVALSGLRGEVVKQLPPPGTMLAEGRTVRLYVAVGTGARELARVPDLKGPSENASRDEARRAGFTVRTRERLVRNKKKIGTVLEQRPAAGTSLPVLSQITIVVGR